MAGPNQLLKRGNKKLNYKYLDIKDLNKNKYHKNMKSKLFWNIILTILLLTVIGTALWCFYGEMDVIVKAEGLIKNEDNISYIYSIKGGYIKYIIPSENNKIHKNELLLALSTKKLQSRISYLKSKITTLTKKIDDLEHLYHYLKHGQLLKEIHTSVINNEFKSIQAKLNYLKENINNQKEDYDRLLPFKNLSITANKLEKEKQKIADLKYELEAYKNNKLLSIEKRIRNLEDELITKKIEYTKLKTNLNQYKIYAPIDGRLEYLNKYNNGDYIPSGVKIMKIIPSSSNEYQVELFVKNKDILKLNKGDLVRFKIASYPYKEHGVAKGRILQINTDTTSVNDKNYGYKVVASINNYLIKGQKQTEVKYKNGMLTNASIVVGKRKILYYILEKLDFLNAGVF